MVFGLFDTHFGKSYIIHGKKCGQFKSSKSGPDEFKLFSYLKMRSMLATDIRVNVDKMFN